MAASSGGAHTTPPEHPNPDSTHPSDQVVLREHEEVVVRGSDGITVRDKEVLEITTTEGDVVRAFHSTEDKGRPARPAYSEVAPVVGHKGCILNGRIGGRTRDRRDPMARHRHLLEHSFSRDMGCTSQYYTQYFDQHDIVQRLTDHRFFPVRSRARFEGQGRSTGRPTSPTRKLMQWKRPPSFESAKCLWIFRNGDGHDYGTRYYLKTNLGRYSLKNIYAELSDILKPPGGAIRELYDQKLDRITKVGQLVDGGCYLACEGNGPTPNRRRLMRFMSA